MNELNFKKIKNLLNLTNSNQNKKYIFLPEKSNPAGYHTLYFNNYKIEGERDCKLRVNDMRKFYDFKNKNIIDFGCNTGGILFELMDEINYGIGIDLNHKCINSANFINSIYKKNIHFYNLNLENDIYIINNLISVKK